MAFDSGGIRRSTIPVTWKNPQFRRQQTLRFDRQRNLRFGRQQNPLSRLFVNRDAETGFPGGIVYRRERAAVPRLYTSDGTLVGARAAEPPGRSGVKSAAKRILEQIRNGTYPDWESASLYHKVDLVNRLFGGEEDAAAQSGDPSDRRDKKDDAVSGSAAEGGLFTGTKAPKQTEQCVLKTSARDVAEQMKKGGYQYELEDGRVYVQGQKDSGEPDMKKSCRAEDLRSVLGYDRPKTVSAKDNAVAFDDDSVYRFVGSDGKEHNVVSSGGVLGDDVFNAFHGREDREAADYAGFWNALARGDMREIREKYSEEEIRDRLSGAGIGSGPFTVKVGDRSETYYLPDPEKKMFPA